MLWWSWRLLPWLAAWLLSGCAVIPPPRALWNLSRPAPAAGDDRTGFNRSVYDNVWNWVKDYYYDENFNGVDWRAAGERHRDAAIQAKDDAELYAAINSLLGELRDRHTYAQPAPEFARSFRRLNVVLGWRATEMTAAGDGRRRIIEVFPNSPAAAAGVREGWIIVACDGRPPGEVTGPGKLQEGQAVRCDFLTDSGEPRTLTLVARQVVVPTFRRVEEVGEGVFSIRFDQFNRPAARWVREQVKAHADAKALIFDLRGNPGGHVFALGAILGDVFPKPVEIGKLVHRGDVAWWHRFIRQRNGAHYSGRIVVLVSPFTSSAAEIFAQLVQENGRGPIVGQKTGGVLLTTVFWPLAGGGKLWLTVYDYHSPKGTRVEGRGVLPDIEMPRPAGAPVNGRDLEVDAALQALGIPPRDRAPPE